MIATDFHDICDNDLIAELVELWEQTPTWKGKRLANRIQDELIRRDERRQQLIDCFD